MTDLAIPDIQTDEIAALNKKLDYLTELLEEQRKLMEERRQQRQQQQQNQS